MADFMTPTTRDTETSKIKSGVRIAPIWPGARVHAFRADHPTETDTESDS